MDGGLKSENLLLADVTMEILKQVVEIELRLKRIESITLPK